nr:claspin-like isoform X1 [Megalopta genalis]
MSENSGLDDAKTDKESNEVDKCIENESSKEVENPIEEVSKTSVVVNNDCTDNANSTIFNAEETNERNEEEDSIAENEELQVVKNVKKFSRIIDSDSEDEDTFNSKTKEITSLNNLFEDKKHSNEKSSKKLFDSDTDDDTYVSLNKSNTERILNEEKAQTGFRTLIDSDTEEEEINETHLDRVEGKEPKQQKEHGESSKRKVSLRASKEEAMKHIQSETQRLLRETEVSLPYHRPKQRTLEEFLNRRKVLSALPKAPTMAAKLKISSAIIDKALKEKEEEAETFYKSSDSEEEITESQSVVADAEYIQKTKKEVVPKKLFVCDELPVNSKEDDNTSVMHEANGNITEINETKNCSPMEIDTVRIEELETLKSNCDTTATENANEHILPKITNEVEESCKEGDTILQDEIIENKDNEINTAKKSPQGKCENEKYNLRTDDDSSNESSSNVIDYAKMVKQSLGITAEESDEYNEYGLSPPKLDITPKANEKKTLSRTRNTTPKLRGAPGTVIDLTGDTKPNKNPINAFLDRFVYKHSKIKNAANDTSKVTVTQMIESPDGSSIEVKETLPYKPKNSEKMDPKLQKPGAKLLLLKQELKEKIALKRDEEWKEKEQEMKEHEIEWNETFDEGDKFSKLPSIATYESEEDELEEDDMYEKKEKKRRKCEFVDDEADVSDDEIDEQDGIIDEDEDEDEDENVEKDEESFILEDDESSTCDSIDVKRKSFRRIVEPIEDDSRSCDTLNNEVAANMDNEKRLSSTTTHSDMFHESPSENEKDIPVSQAHVENDLEHKLNRTPVIRKTNNFSFVSPATQLTALSSRLEDLRQMTPIREESLVEESNPNLIESPRIGELSQQCGSDSRPTMPKKLFFTDQNDIMEDELMELCSGKFMTCEPGMSLDYAKLPDATAGGNLPDSENLEKNLQESPTKRNSVSTNGDAIREQLKGNYDSREKSSVSSNTDDEDEDSTMQEISNRTKKKVTRLELSDDEEENECSVSSGDDIRSECDEDKFIDYDSEENEVVVPKKSIKQYAATFLENEAELSESDCDCDVSADEDEEDMDDLELEEGDDEEIDETQVKNQLGKLHMKQLLDEDQKEVRILKELLFEEGDLFSESGRERKFKWKNINKQDANDQSQPCEDKDGCVDLSDEEDEAKWRKIRHEREKFLAEKMINVDTEIESDLNNSQIFKFGMKILKKRRIDGNQTENTLLDSSVSAAETRMPHTVAEMLNSSDLKGNSRVIHKVLRKRSILARGEETLARLAVLARQKDAPVLSKNAKNFVFTHIDTAEETTTETIGKRKANAAK